MLCSRFLRPPASERHGRLYEITERCVRRAARRLPTQPDRVMRHRRATHGAARARDSAGDRLDLLTLIPKGFLPSEDTRPDSDVHPGGAGDFVRRDGGASGGARRHDLGAIPTSTTTSPASAPAAPSGASNTRHPVRASEAASQRKLSVDQVIDELRPQARRRFPGMMVFLQNPPPIQIGAQFTEAPTSSPCRAPTPTNSTSTRRFWNAKCNRCAS